MLWGNYQKESHRLLNEVFPTRDDAYKWLSKKYGISHFSELDYKNEKDKQKLQDIYHALWVLSFKTLE